MAAAAGEVRDPASTSPDRQGTSSVAVPSDVAREVHEAGPQVDGVEDERHEASRPRHCLHHSRRRPRLGDPRRRRHPGQPMARSGPGTRHSCHGPDLRRGHRHPGTAGRLNLLRHPGPVGAVRTVAAHRPCSRARSGPHHQGPPARQHEPHSCALQQRGRRGAAFAVTCPLAATNNPTPRDPADYRRARSAVREAARTAAQPGIEQETRQRAAEHDAALRAHREPEGAFADGQAALDAARRRPASSSHDARFRALAYKPALRNGERSTPVQARMHRSA